MSIRWTNNATSLLASDITAGTLSITVTTGQGDRFPEVVAPHYCMVTLVDTSGNREIVKVTARAAASNTMTIERAQEGTSARSFAAGSLVEQRITKNSMDEFSKAADINAQHFVCDASAADQGATTNTSSLKSLVDALGATEEATIDLPHTGTGDTTTYTVGTNLTIPATVTLRVHKGVRISPSGGVTLTVNGIVQAGAYTIFAGAGTVTVNTYPQDQAWWGSAQRLDGNINGFSANNTAMRATHDPYPAAAENLPVSLQEEIQSIRYLLAQITGKTYWYQDPDTTINSIYNAIGAFETTAGTGSAYTLTISPAPTIAAGTVIRFKAHVYCNADVTLNVNSAGAAAIKKAGNLANLALGDLRTGQVVTVVWDGTYWQLQGDPGDPVGSFKKHSIETVPNGYLECNGQSVLRASYPELFAVIGTIYGTADGTHFNVPDMRGTFARGWDHGKGSDPDAATRLAVTTPGATMTAGDHVGTTQVDEIKAHKHGLATRADVQSGTGLTLPKDGTASDTETANNLGDETRPINRAVMFIIKF